MAINFPDNPTIGDTYTSGQRTWRWDGVSWNAYGIVPDPTVLRIDSVNGRVGVNNSSPAADLDVTGDAAISGSLTVDGDLTISGNTTTLNTTELFVEDNKVMLNSGATGSATINAGIEVERGDDPNVEILWDESVDAWKVATDFTVDAGTLHVDSTNNRVGINNTSPTVDLDVTGDVSISGTLAVGLNTDVEASITNINELQQNEQTGTTYTLALTDDGKVVEMNNASANTLTVPPNSSVAFPVGSQILVLQTGAGQTTVAAGAGVTVNSKDGNLKLSAQWSAATLIKRATDTWVAIGDLSA
jgi:hypothetical protein